MSNGLPFKRPGDDVVRIVIEFVPGSEECVVTGPLKSPSLCYMGLEMARDVIFKNANPLALSIAPAGANRVTFNGMGWVVDNLDATPTIATIDVKSTVIPAPETRPLRVFVTKAGATKMCDPAVASPDPRAC